MKSVKYYSIFLLLLSIFISSPSYTGFEDYKDATLEQIIAITDDYYKKHGKAGFTTKLMALKLKIDIQQFPVEITEGGKNIVKNYFLFTPQMDKKFIPIYTHEMKHTYKNKKFCFMFQKELVEYLKTECKIGSRITIHAIFGLFNSFDQEHMLLVNGYSADMETDSEKVKL